MSQINDAIKTAVGSQINDGLATYYGKTADESLSDATRRWLITNGATPAAINDMWHDVLSTAGYSGTISDMKLAFWGAGGSISPSTAPDAPINLTLTEGVNKTAVILLAGQSNMVGRYGPVDGVLDVTDSRITQFGHSTNTETLASDPLDHWDEVANTVGMGMTIAKAHLANGASKVLLVPAADGSTGFSSGEWIDTGAQSIHAITAANAAIALHPDNELVAIIWHQGEKDQFISKANYKTFMEALILRFRTQITGAANVPFIVGQIPYWSTQYGTGDIQGAIEALPVNNANMSLAVTGDLADGGDSLHFSAASERTLGQRYYDRYLNVLNPPTVSADAESGAAAHWLLGSSDSEMRDMLHQYPLIPNNAGSVPTLSPTHVTLNATSAGGLNTPIIDSATQTMVMVVRHTATTNQGVVFGGTLGPVNGSAVFRFASTGNLSWAIKGSATQTFGTFVDDAWVFIAFSIDNANSGLFIGNSVASQYQAVVAGSKLVSTDNVSVGRSQHTSALYEDAFDIAEFMVFDTALTQTEMQAIYTRSTTRLAARSIIIN